MKNKSYLFLLIFLVPLIINPFGFSFYEIPKSVYLTLFLLCAIIVIFIYLIRKKQLELKFNKYVYLLLGGWLVSLIISTVLSIAPGLSFFGSYVRFQGLFSHILYILFFIIFLHLIIDKKFLDKALKVILGVGLFVSIYAFLQRLGIDIYAFNSNDIFTGRTFATFGHPNFLGQFLLLPIWISIFLAKDTKKSKTRNLYILATLILLSALLTTENRASILGFGVSFIAFILSVVPFKKIYKALIGAGIIGAGASFILIAAPSLRSISSRLVIWKDSMNVIWDNPIFGSGLETFRAAIQKYVSADIYNFENLYDVSDRAHNILIDTAATQGLFGLTVLLLIIGVLTVAFLKNLKLLKNISFGIGSFTIMAVLITMFFSFPLLSDWIVIYAALAMFIRGIVKFKKVKIRLNALSIFIFSMLITALVFANIYTINTLRADVLYSKGLNEFQELNISESFGYFVEANEINPYQDEIHYKTGLLFSVLSSELDGNNDTAVIENYIDNAGWFNGKDFQYYIYKGIVNTYNHNFEKAEVSFITASEKAPNNAFLWENWGHKYYLEGDYGKAIYAYKKLIEITPEYWMWTIDIDERSEDEKRKYRIFFKTVPMFLQSIERLADSYRKLGDIEKGDYYDQFLTIKNKSDH